MANSLLSWKTKKLIQFQHHQLRQNTKLWLEQHARLLGFWALFKDFGVNRMNPVHLICDNKAAIHISNNPMYHERQNI